MELEKMIGLLTTLALIATSMAVIVGALTPGEAFRRVAAALALVLVVPYLIFCAIYALIAPMLAGVVTVLANAAYILGIVAAIALLGWIISRYVHNRSGSRREKPDEE